MRIFAAEAGATSAGSGTLVATDPNHGLVVTNWHVVRDATGEIEVVFPDGFRSAATVLKTDKDWDLAALLIWRPYATPIRIASMPPQPGDALTIAGYGGGAYRSVRARCTQYVAPGPNFPYEMVEVAAQARTREIQAGRSCSAARHWPNHSTNFQLGKLLFSRSNKTPLVSQPKKGMKATEAYQAFGVL